jgi:hypothetical protein
MDLSAAAIWPEAPTISEKHSTDQPAMVTVEYRITEENWAAFQSAIAAFSKERLRDGATQWHLHQNVEDSQLWIETFYLPSWAEHLEQHKRVTKNDADLQAQVRAFDMRDGGPVVRHYVVSK